MENLLLSLDVSVVFPAIVSESGRDCKLGRGVSRGSAFFFAHPLAFFNRICYDERKTKEWDAADYGTEEKNGFQKAFGGAACPDPLRRTVLRPRKRYGAGSGGGAGDG
ncbi:MAG: hypothetical protein II680_14755 [Clostridia bacterium]|nr:hypothetical protein [Clostridia bacterium]